MGSRTETLSCIRGSKVRIPDLETLLSDWPQGCSPFEEDVKYDVDARLESILPPCTRLKKMKAAKVETFTATWWPHATHEALAFAAYLAIWLFLWDDDTDTPEYTTALVSSIPAARAFRAETLLYVRRCLNPNRVPYSLPEPESPVISSFRPIAEAVLATFTEQQKQQFQQQLEIWVMTTATEQWHEVTGKLPSVERYLEERVGSSAVGVCLAICEYMLGIDLPYHIREDDDMAALWKQTNIIISVANDMLSFKKEMEHDRLDNILILMYLQYRDLQKAMDGAFEVVREAKVALDAAGVDLVARHEREDVRRFVECCKTMCIGNNSWSLRSGRYKLGMESLVGGVEIQV